MSKEIRDFAAAFTPGLKLGLDWRSKVEANRIDAERNKLKARADAMREARENRRVDIYAQSVTDAGILARARAEAALRPKGGGVGKAPPVNTDEMTAQLLRDAAERGIIGAPPPAPVVSGGDTFINQGPDASSEGSGAPLNPPAEGIVPEIRQGGMVRKMAGGGSIEQGAGMTLEQALRYGDQPARGEAAGAASGLASGLRVGQALNKAYQNYNKPAVTPTGPQGSGAGGAYTVGDSGPNGILSRGLPQVPVDPVLVNRNGGTVRRFQSGGRVMEQAIDTGMSGPGSGLGQRASPPPGGRRY